MENNEIDFDLPEIEFQDFEFDASAGFNVTDDLFIDSWNTRILKPTLNKEIKDCYLKYDNAAKLAESIDLSANFRYFVIVNGAFIFGDFLDAFLCVNDMIAWEMTVSTLSLSEENIYCFADLLNNGWIRKLNMVVSHYFYANYRKTLIPLMYELLDKEDRFQLSICSTHCKLVLIETVDERFYVIHGSANLRSSQNLEQIVIEENKELYDFNHEYHTALIEKYKTINKPIRSKLLWQVVQEAEAKKAEL